MTIIVTGQIDYDPANREKAVAAVVACQNATRAEEGNEFYAFSEDIETPGRVYVTELWASQEAIDLHNATPHLAALMGAMGELGVTAVNLTRWDGATPTKMM
jgi:quinol monooxygenase YgiN